MNIELHENRAAALLSRALPVLRNREQVHALRLGPGSRLSAVVGRRDNDSGRRTLDVRSFKARRFFSGYIELALKLEDRREITLSVTPFSCAPDNFRRLRRFLLRIYAERNDARD